MFVAPDGEGSPWKGSGEVEKPKITGMKKKHPLVRWVALKDVEFSTTAKKLSAIKKDQVAATSGPHPMILSRREGERNLVALAFDLRGSDMPLRISLPVMMV